MAEETPAEFLKRTTGRGDSAGETPEQFLARTAPKGAETTKAEAPSPPPYGVSPSEYDPNDIAPDPRVLKAFEGFPSMRNALKPEPGYVRPPWPLSMLPLSFKETTPGSGQIDPSSGLSGLRYDPGSTVSSLGANGLLDLLEGTGFAESAGGMAAPKAGTVSPEATALLFGAKMGNPVRQFRHPLEAPGRDIQFGAPEARPPSTGDIAAAPLPPEFTAAPMAPEAKAAAATMTPGAPEGAPTTPTGIPVTPPKPEPTTAPVLSAADHQWAGGMRDRLAEIAAENKEAGIPGDLGAAATPEQLAKLTPAQMKAYRAQVELGDILAPPNPGMDKSIYVHGSEPTLAEYSGSPSVSQKESLHRERAPDQYEPRLKANMQARVDSYESMQGTQPQLQDIRDLKAAAAEKDGAAFMKVARPLDLSPALEWVDAKLADPRVTESSSRVKILKELRASLFDETGNLKTDPGSGWGMHDNMIDALDKAKDRTTAERYAQKLLVEYKRIIDGVNNTASDGAFQTFLDNQTNYARQINSMEELQKFRPRFTNAKGDINAAAFHRFVADLAARRARSGVDPAMSVSDDTMHGLINIDKDLKRATNIDLGKSRGSQTNLFFTLAQATGLGAAHLGAAALSHGNPTANLFLQGAMNQAGKMTGNLLLRRAVRKGLSPPPGGYDYNPLIPPGSNAPP